VCIKLFIPKRVAETVFPLSESQISVLNDIGAKNLKDYTESDMTK